MNLNTGYPTHFGQLECMKLVASPHFPEKRIGYLGMMLLLSEEADVLMLATNALKNDLTSQNRFVAGLALACIGNLATADMSRDLAPEVDKHLSSPLSYLRKKSCLAMARCLAKCPDMVEDFTDRIADLLRDKSHGVLITVVQLMTQVLMIDYKNAEEEGDDPFSTETRQAFVKIVPSLVKMLRNLLGSNYSPEYDVGGIADPFLQVQLLTLLRLLGVNDHDVCEEMNDVLAQVASNTDTSKNAGNAILYECVTTIMGTPSEDGLRVLAVNILGRFLLNRDNNIRYVALNTLSKCIVNNNATATGALQRHRTTVVDCLKDPDVSIRQRALELMYHLVNESNVEDLTAELLNYLVLCPREHRLDIIEKILKVVDRYSPDDQWRVDTLITTLTIAGREAAVDVQNATIIYISRSSSDIHKFASHKLLKAIRDDDGTQHGLLSVGVWCIGEYGDLLLQPCSYQGKASDNLESVTFMALDASTVVETVETVMKRHSCPESIQNVCLTAFVKLGNRYANDPVASSKIQTILQQHRGSRSIELQVRSCEYNTLLNAAKGIATAAPPPSDDIFGVSEPSGGAVGEGVKSAAKEALSRMPVVDIKILQKRLNKNDFGEHTPVVSRKVQANGGGGGDLLDIFGGDETAPAVNGGTVAADTGKSDLDLLSDIFAAGPAAAAPAPAAGSYDPFSNGPPVAAAAPAAVNPMDLFGAPPASTPAPAAPAMDDIFGAPPAQQSSAPVADIFGAPPAAPTTPRVPAFTHAGLAVEFECTKPEPMNNQKSVLIAHFNNTTNAPINGMNLQVAVPKFIKMEMEPPSSTTIPPSGSSGKPVTQKITVTNSMLGTKNLVLKVKVGFTSNGQKIDHLATCSGFPAGQY